MLNNLRYALRLLRNNPGFALVAILTLAICIGSNLTIFAVVDSILVRSLPYRDPDRLVTLYNTYPKANIARALVSATSYYERRGHIPAFISLADINETTSVIGDTGSTTIEKLGRVTPEFFSTLGVEPFMGRSFREEELTYNTDQVAIITYEYWHNQFNADPNVLGKTVRTDGLTRVVVGVLPPGFRFLSFEAPIYLPRSSQASERSVNARHTSNDVQIARLAPDVSLAQAQSEVDADNDAIAPEFPEAKIVADAGFRTFVAPLHADHVASVRPMLLLLQGGVFLLLLIGGVNLVNLLLIRASGRAKEFAIRQSIGATRRHVVNQVTTETVLLTMIGGVLGLVVGMMGIHLLNALGVDQLPLGAHISFDGRLAMAALLGSLVLGLALAAPIAWFNLRGQLADALQSDSRGGTTSHAAQRLRHAFIVVQIALAFILLTGSGLLAVSLNRAMAVSPGFRADHVMTGQFTLTWNGYHEQNSFTQFFDRLLTQTSHVPGVSAVGAISNVPVNGEGDNDVMSVPGYHAAPGESVVVHDVFAVAGDYFTAMGIPLREGRFLNEADNTGSQMPIVVDETFARRYWPQGGAIGKQVYRGTKIGDDGDKPFTVVGVVGSVKQTGLAEKDALDAVYFPYSQYFNRNYFLVARSSIPPQALAGTLRQIVRKIDPELPLTDIRPMDARIADSLSTRRSPVLLAAIFAGVALLLAAIGTYGVLSYAVTQRRREIGIRMALGALPGQIRNQFLSIGLRLLTAGCIFGLVGAWLAGRAMQSILFGVSGIPVGTLAITAAVMSAISLIACWLPARSASRVDPMVALRCE